MPSPRIPEPRTRPDRRLPGSKIRLAIVVSHPVQYYVPLYRSLVQRGDLSVKVFFTWHAGDTAVQDHGFRQAVAWDIPLTEGYEFERVPNVSDDPGTHHFFGLRNPSLIDRVMAWRPDAVHITGWAWHSHLLALRGFSRRGVPVLFRGDSHLLDAKLKGLRWWLKRLILKHVYSWPTAFLFVGSANRAYYEAFGVSPVQLHYCPHSIDVARFAEPSDVFEKEAALWRTQLGLADCVVLLFAGKFERKKRPLELMRAVQALGAPNVKLLMVGAGELENDVHAIATADPGRFRVLSFQNQSRMPVVYRLGDVFILPSAFDETWGLAVNEAMACGRPVIASDRVGSAHDVIDATCGRVFHWSDYAAMMTTINCLVLNRKELPQMGSAAARRALAFDIERTEVTLARCLMSVVNP